MSDKKPEPYKFVSYGATGASSGLPYSGTHASAVGSVRAAPVASAVTAPFKMPNLLEQALRENIRVYPVTLDLPPEYFALISKIVTHWALAEWVLLGTLGALSGIDRKEGRILFGVRLGDTMQKIKQLMDVYDMTLPQDWPALVSNVNKCEENRNLVAHGVWLIDPDTNELCIQNPSGEWSIKDEANKTHKASKRKYPEAKYVDQEWLEDAFALVTSTLQQIHQFDAKIASA